MGMIRCPECGCALSDEADKCLTCGYPIAKKMRKKKKIKWTKLKVVSLISLFLSFMFFTAIFKSGGGPENNVSMMVSTWFFLMAGICGLLGYQSMSIAVASVVLWFAGMLYNIVAMIFLPTHIILAINCLTFGILALIDVCKGTFRTKILN